MKNFIFTAFLLCPFLVGCGGDGAEELTVFPVTGKVTKGGSPLAEVTVSLAAQGATQAPMLIGVTKEDGTFEIATNAGQKGAPAGEYKVKLRSNTAEMDYSTGKPKNPDAKDAIPAKYTSEEKTDVSITVTADGENVINIEIP
jgi:5-hydroxyisourate hydrolase-like protein (transthyretin family)